MLTSLLLHFTTMSGKSFISNIPSDYNCLEPFQEEFSVACIKGRKTEPIVLQGNFLLEFDPLPQTNWI